MLTLHYTPFTVRQIMCIVDVHLDNTVMGNQTKTRSVLLRKDIKIVHHNSQYKKYIP